MALFTFRDRDEFRKSVISFLEMHEAENALFLGAFARFTSGTAIMALAAEDKPLGAFFYGEISAIITQGVDESSALSLARYLISERVDIPAVVGPTAEVNLFTPIWVEVRGCRSRLAFEHGLYTLTEVIWPTRPAGNERLATTAELDLLTDWFCNFQDEAVRGEPYDREGLRRNMETRISEDMMFVWERNGETVSMASLARPTKRSISVNAVYTPPEHRGCGYASALVAAVSAEGLRRGKSICALYTDLANPTSNSIYQKIGYRFASHSTQYRFNYE